MSTVLADSIFEHDKHFGDLINMIAADLYDEDREAHPIEQNKYYKHKKIPLKLHEKKAMRKVRLNKAYGTAEVDDNEGNVESGNQNDSDDDNVMDIDANSHDKSKQENDEHDGFHNANSVDISSSNEGNTSSMDMLRKRLHDKIQKLQNQRMGKGRKKNNNNTNSNKGLAISMSNNDNDSANGSVKDDHRSIIKDIAASSSSSSGKKQKEKDPASDNNSNRNDGSSSSNGSSSSSNKNKRKNRDKDDGVEDIGDISFNSFTGNNSSSAEGKAKYGSGQNAPGSKVRRLKRMLGEAEKKRERIKALKSQGKAGETQLKDLAWNDTLQSAAGSRKHIDVEKVRKAMKKKLKAANQSAAEWSKRNALTESNKQARIDKREGNIESRQKRHSLKVDPTSDTATGRSGSGRGGFEGRQKKMLTGNAANTSGESSNNKNKR